MIERSGFADAAGLNIHFVEAGDGPPVVLLHGFPEFWFSWRKQIPALAAGGFRAIAADLPGYNESAKPEDAASYSMPALAAKIAAFMRSVAGGPCRLVGHDWGGFVAWFVAMAHPDAVERLVILNAPHPLALRREMQHLNQKLRMSYQLLLRPRRFSELLMRAFNFLFLRLVLTRNGKFTNDEIERYVEVWRRDGALTAMANYYRAVGRSAGVRQMMRTIAVPVLMIWGDRDPVFSLATTERYEEWAPNLRVEHIPTARHFVQADAPERVNELLLAFLR